MRKSSERRDFQLRFEDCFQAKADLRQRKTSEGSMIPGKNFVEVSLSFFLEENAQTCKFGGFTSAHVCYAR
jgi:hypothetical protein